MELWGGLLAERAAGDAPELSAAGGEALSLDVARLEGCGLVCLASHDEAVRREALQVRGGAVVAGERGGGSCLLPLQQEAGGGAGQGEGRRGAGEGC